MKVRGREQVKAVSWAGKWNVEWLTLRFKMDSREISKLRGIHNVVNALRFQLFFLEMCCKSQNWNTCLFRKKN